jgi:uncharacterized phiE125 gp8 family phage protein
MGLSMKSILTSPPQAEPVTLAEAKAHLRVDTSEEDALIGKLIAAARRHVEAQTGLALIAQGWSHFLDRWPCGREVELPLGPLLSIDEVRVYGEDDEASIIDPAHYFADAVARPARLVLRQDRLWPQPGRVANGIEIKVTAGFGDEPEDVPEDLSDAMLRLLAYWFENRGDEDRPALPPLGVEMLLQPFRELRL